MSADIDQNQMDHRADLLRKELLYFFYLLRQFNTYRTQAGDKALWDSAKIVRALCDALRVEVPEEVRRRA